MSEVATDRRLAAYRDAWLGDATFATTLLLMLIDIYDPGDEAAKDDEENKSSPIYWHPDTIKMEIEEDFGIQLPPANFEKLMAAIAIIRTDDFWWSLPDFISICNVLNGDLDDNELWDPADAAEIAWGVTEAAMLHPPRNDEPFTDEIRGYIGEVLRAEGIITPPDILRLATGENLALKVQGEFSDDPVMYASIHEFEAGKTSAINEYVRNSLQLLSAQLEQLPLRVGTTKGVVAAVLRALRSPSQRDDLVGTIDI